MKQNKIKSCNLSDQSLEEKLIGEMSLPTGFQSVHTISTPHPTPTCARSQTPTAA